MNIAIRKMIDTDAKHVTRLSEQLGYEIPVDDTVNQINIISSSTEHCVYVALYDTTIVGWIHAFVAVRIESKPFIEIGGLVVDEAYRGNGIGKMLIDMIKDWCIENGFPVLRLRTNAKRNDAHRFYQQLGFAETKGQKVFEIRFT